MSFFYENILNWVRHEIESLRPEDRLDWLILLQQAVEELIAELEK